MDKFWDFIKEHRLTVVACVIIILFAVVGVPLLISWAFSIPAWCDLFAVDWDAKDALSFYGSALGFIGTVIFSVLALWQNHIIKVESDRHTDILEEMERKKNLPIIFVGGGSHTYPCQNISININNLSDNIALEMVISRIFILNKDGTEFWSNDKETKTSYLKRGSITVSLKNPPITSLDQVFSFTISYQDIFENHHKVLVEGKQLGTKLDFPRFFTKEI